MPDLAQKALNASNAVASQTTEVEVAVGIAEEVKAQVNRGEPIDYVKAVEVMRATNPACNKYCKVIADYVRLYGGGVGAPMIKFIDSFVKAYGENLAIGEEFLAALTNAKKHSRCVKGVSFGPSCTVVHESLEQ